jgi:predicted Zn-dependent peptidase
MEVKLDITEKTIHGIKVVHVKTNNLMSHLAYHCLSGSYHEDEENQGISHYLEHMFFKGTENRDYAQISDDAAINGATQNAFTSELDTCYFLTAPSEKYDPCIELLSDMMFHSTFPVEEVKKENTVIQAERKSYEDSPSSYYWEHMEELLVNFRMGHPVIGTEETIDNINQESLLKFKEEFYGNNNVFFLAMTSASAEDIFASCEKHMKDNGLKEVEVTSLDEPLIPELKDINFTRENIQQSYLSMVFSSPEMNHDDQILESCMRLYLGGGLYGILGKVIREELGLCYHIGAYQIYATPYDGMSCVYTQLDEDNVDLAKERIVEKLTEISNGNVDELLFKCAKAQILAQYCSQMDDPKKLSRWIAKSVLFEFEIDLAKKYNRILDLTFEEFKGYIEGRLETVVANHSWVEMSPEPAVELTELGKAVVETV